jgi:hypothetical protein
VIKFVSDLQQVGGTVEGYMTSIVSTKWLKGNKTLMNKALFILNISLFVLLV